MHWLHKMAVVASVEFGEHAFRIDETTNSTLISQGT
jgi:hypothetical protein